LWLGVEEAHGRYVELDVAAAAAALLLEGARDDGACDCDKG
jgi:hypothetical protein